eukprot:3872956-Rhodomonas_salina.1
MRGDGMDHGVGVLDLEPVLLDPAVFAKHDLPLNRLVQAEREFVLHFPGQPAKALCCVLCAVPHEAPKWGRRVLSLSAASGVLCCSRVFLCCSGTVLRSRELCMDGPGCVLLAARNSDSNALSAHVTLTCSRRT